MTRRDAELIAEILDGEASKEDEAGWLVIFERRDGRLVVLTARAVDEYADREAFQHSACYATIGLRDGRG